MDELGAFLMRQPPVHPLPHPHHISPALLDTNDNNNNDLDEGVYHDSMGRRVSGGGLALEPGLLEEGSTRTLNLNSQSVVSGVSKMGFMTGGNILYLHSFTFLQTPNTPLTHPVTHPLTHLNTL